MGHGSGILGRVDVVHHESWGGLVVCHQRGHTQARVAIGDGLAVWACAGHFDSGGRLGLGVGAASASVDGLKPVGRGLFGLDGLANVSPTCGAECGRTNG